MTKTGAMLTAMMTMAQSGMSIEPGSYDMGIGSRKHDPGYKFRKNKKARKKAKASRRKNRK